MSDSVHIHVGNALDVLRTLPDESVQCCVTSPPYWQKRDYGHALQIGMEKTPELFAQALVPVFDEVLRILSPCGSLWLNVADSYATGGNGGGGSIAGKRRQWREIIGRKGYRKAPPGYKHKDLTLIPFIVAASLRSSGWHLRSTIIWWRRTANEPNRLDRPAVSHEYLFLLTPGPESTVRDPGEPWWSQTVWSIPPSPGANGHPAPMPEALARRCILAGSRKGETILDPFGGSGTTGRVAVELNRKAILIDINPIHATNARQRCQTTPGLGI